MKESQYILSDEEIQDLVLKMDTRVFNLEDLNPAKYNPRFIDQEALDGLGESLNTFGYVQPIIVNVRDNLNIIVGGHQRLKVLRQRGIKKAECVVVDVDEVTEKAMNVSLNNPEISGKWDLNKLEELTSGIKSLVPNYEELKLSLLESNLEINVDEFGDFDDEDEEKSTEPKEKLYTLEIEFLPEDYEMFVDLMDSIDIPFKSPSKKVQYGLKIATYIKEKESTGSSVSSIGSSSSSFNPNDSSIDPSGSSQRSNVSDPGPTISSYGPSDLPFDPNNLSQDLGPEGTDEDY